MNNRLKLKSDNTQKVFFTSDGHFNQENLIPCANRGYSDKESRTLGQIETWNSVVTNDSVVIDHGDLVFNDPKGEFFEYLISQLNFKHLYLIAGNHLSGTKNHFNLDKQSTKKFNGKFVTFLGFYWEFIVNSQLICACHYPLAIWNEMAKGSWNTGGHVHHNYKLSRKDDFSAKIVDVGWDAWHKPIEFLELKKIMDQKGFLRLDHHV